MEKPETPCAKAIRLRQIREDSATGQIITEARFGEDFMKYGKLDAGALDKLIEEADAACAASRGETKPIRKRYAMGVRIRPW